MPGRTEAFYHGTTHDIGVGHYVVPARESGKKNYKGTMGYGGQQSGRHAHATTREDEAWDFATRKVSHSTDQARRQDSPTPQDQRARVYEVAPHPMMRKGIYHPDHPRNRKDVTPVHEWLAPKYKVTAVHDIMPGRQGTIPTVNWNQFSSVKSMMSDANHPTDEEVEHGHSFYQSTAFWEKHEQQNAPKPKRTEVTGQLSLFPHLDERR
jgi:hypothetical protein